MKNNFIFLMIFFLSTHFSVQDCCAQTQGIKIEYYGSASRDKQLASGEPVEWAEIYLNEIALLNDSSRVKELKHLEIDRSWDNPAGNTLPESLWRLDKLEFLRLERFDNTDWKSVFFHLAKLPHLETLEIYLCGDSVLVPEIKLLQQLEELNISICFVRKLPDELFTLTQLRSLSLVACGLSDPLPAKLLALTHLKKLNVSFNHFNTLPDELAQLDYLEALNLEGNNFKQTPAVIYRMKHLEEINLSNNKIGKIEEGLFTISSLRYIDLSRNRISEISPGFKKLSLLSYLDISVNRLKDLPAELLSCDSLSELYCSENRFQQSPVVLKLLILSCHLSDYPEQLQDSILFYTDKIAAANEIKPRKKFLQDMQTPFIGCYTITPQLTGVMDCGIAYNFDYKKKDENLEIYGWLPFRYRKNSAYKMARYLDMTMYDLPILPFGFRRIKNLTEAEIRREEAWIGVRRMVRPLKRCHNMKRLWLTDEMLKHLPRSIYKMKQLEYLEINCPEIKTLPAWLSKMPGLKTIKVHGHVKVPDAIRRTGIIIIEV